MMIMIMMIMIMIMMMFRTTRAQQPALECGGVMQRYRCGDDCMTYPK